MADVEAIVIGAGVVGLAVARALALAGRSVLVLEGEAAFGTWTSSRNSEVVHAGLYYPTGSNKAKLCVEGRHQLYSYCEARGVPYRRTEKIVFSTSAVQSRYLASLRDTALANGVGDVTLLEAEDVRRLEPCLGEVAAGLHSPSTGIVDAHAFMLALLGDAEAHGASLVVRTSVRQATRSPNGWRIYIEGEADAIVSTRCIVNCAGLAAQAVAAGIEGLAPSWVPPLHLARGVYFSYSGKVPFSRLIYPAPEPGGLGLHLTLDLGGQARFGPDVEWIEQVDYRVDEGRKGAFVAGARRIWSGIDPDRLQPGYAGVRPKLSGPGEPAADFVISGPQDHGCEGLVNLFGIESPGLTAALAIADVVRDMLRP